MAARYAPRRVATIALALLLAACEGINPPPPRPLNTTPELEALGQSWEEGLAKGMAMLIVAGPKIRSGDELGSFRSWQGGAALFRAKRVVQRARLAFAAVSAGVLPKLLRR